MNMIYQQFVTLMLSLREPAINNLTPQARCTRVETPGDIVKIKTEEGRLSCERVFDCRGTAGS